MFFLPIRPELCCVALPIEQPSNLGLIASFQRGQRLPFSIAESNSTSFFLYSNIQASKNIVFSLSSGVHQRRFIVGAPIWHIEDLRIGTHWIHPSEFFGLSIQTKLPNTQDSPLTGTDETDWSGLLFGQLPYQNHRIVLGGGLAIWGDPNRFASQDDGFLFLGRYSYTAASWQGQLGIGGSATSPQQPSQVSFISGVELGQCIQFNMSSNIGLSQAAPQFGGSFGFEYNAQACISKRSD